MVAPRVRNMLGMKSSIYILFMKLIGVAVLLFLVFFGRGVRAAILVTVMVIPLWLLVEMVNVDSEFADLWQSIEEKEEFSELPLKDDMISLKKARKGQRVKQALIEGRIKEQIYRLIMIDQNLSDEELRDLKKDDEALVERLDNELLREYIRKAIDLNDLKSPGEVDGTTMFSDEGSKRTDQTTKEFEEKIRAAIEELEKAYGIEET